MAITEWDDYLIHQVNRTMDTVASDSPNAMDRIWLGAYPADGDYHLMAGLCVYPNKQLMDGFLLIRKGDVQRNVRFSRHAVEGRFDTKIGPLSFAVLQPQKRWKLRLDENEFGIGCDLDWEARSPSYLFEQANPMDTPIEGFSHYKQFGEASGTITFEGEQIPLQSTPALRDRSWGVRDPHIVAKMDFLLVIEGHFADRIVLLNFRRQEGAIVYDTGEVVRFVSIRERVTFDPATKQVSLVEMLAEDERGATHTMVARSLSPLAYYSGGGYDGRHGRDLGPFHAEGERWDLAHDHGVGGVFPYYAKVAELEFDGEPGVGHVEAYLSQDPNWTYTPTWPAGE